MTGSEISDAAASPLVGEGGPAKLGRMRGARPKGGDPSSVIASRSHLLPQGQKGRAAVDRFSAGPSAFSLLTACASRRERIAYADFAFTLGLGSPRALGWLLTPLLEWCRASGLPSLPIIVVRQADGLPSGGYDREMIAAETARVFDHDWTRIVPPTSHDLGRHALPRLPAAIRGAPQLAGASPC